AYPKNKTIIVMSTLDPETMNHLGKKVEANTRMRKKPHGLLPCGFYAAFPPLANFRTIFNLQILSVNEHQNTNLDHKFGLPISRLQIIFDLVFRTHFFQKL